jgi:aminoglycoside phosphotransferase (APT) family kinase protein
VAEDFLAALSAGGALPATGTAHGHVRLQNGLLARVAYAHEGDPTATSRLQAQAAAFRYLAPAGRTPRLHDVIEPRGGLPGGALVVDFIEGRAPRLPGELGAMAETLALIHALPLPPASSPIPRQNNPFLETLEGIELNAKRFLDKAVPDQGARAEIAEELRALRGMALALGRQAQPLTVALADTHPGNFIIDRAGLAWFVDLEKVHVGSPAIDLAHATLPTSTLWHPDVGALLSRDRRAGFSGELLRAPRQEAGRGAAPVDRPDATADLVAHHFIHGAMARGNSGTARSFQYHPMERFGSRAQDEASHR